MIKSDGSLKRVTFDDAYRLACRHLPYPFFEEVEMIHDRAIRRFAAKHLLPADCGYFLYRAGVKITESKYASAYADLCIANARDNAYGDEMADPYDYTSYFDHLLSLMKEETPHRIPEVGELVFAREISVIPGSADTSCRPF